MILNYPYISYILVCLGALALSLFSMPNIMYVAKKKKLLDMPDNKRKLHKKVVPNLGGVGIFFAFIIVASLGIKSREFSSWTYISAASLILFITGIKDDLVAISPTKKFIAQFAAALIVVCFADVRLYSLHGLLGLQRLPDWFSISFSVIGCIFVTNAFNLIDGIDGLAGTIGAFITLIFGIGLAAEGNFSAAIISFSLLGAIIGFLRFNIAPAKIFMGDTGSLIIGFLVSVLAIQFINSYSPLRLVPTVTGSGVLALSVLFIPIFDTFRVFTTRIIKGHSPFRADRTHMHHYLLDLGLNHSQTVMILLTSNILIVVVSLGAQQYNINMALGSLLIISFGLYALLYFIRKNKLANQKLHLSSETITNIQSSNDHHHNHENGKNDITMHATLIVNGNKILVDEPDELLEQD